MTQRHIYKNATTAQHAVKDALTAVFTQELLAPSDEIFLVEPWISNVVIIDNRDGTFDTLNPEWGKREVRLAEVLATLASGGTQIHIVIRPEAHNKRFCSKLSDALSDAAAHDRCTVREVAHLHTKGILTRYTALKGSMNLTENGIAFNDEYMLIAFDEKTIAESRVHFQSYLAT